MQTTEHSYRVYLSFVVVVVNNKPELHGYLHRDVSDLHGLNDRSTTLLLGRPKAGKNEHTASELTTINRRTFETYL